MKNTIILALVLSFSAVTGQAATLVVPTQYATIQAAVNAATTGDIVLVTPGIYSDVTHQANGDTTRCAVVMKSGITVRGAGQSATIINCGSRGRGFHCQRVVNATIEELTVREAFAHIRGAGILVADTSVVTIRNCTVTHCYDGGIIVYRGSTPTITGCTLTDNLNKEGGGMLVQLDSAPTVTDCFFFRNGAPGGGGIMVRDNSGGTFRGCLVNNNSVNMATGNGGGISVISSHPVVDNCTFVGNSCPTGGGGVHARGSNLHLTNCTIQSNRTTGTDGPGGGILLDDATDATIEGCTITDNRIEGPGFILDGGGVAFFGANAVTMRQCTIASNTTVLGLGSGIICYMSDPALESFSIEKCVIAYNSPGEGLYCMDANSVPTTSCTDLWGNVGGNSICGTNAGHNFSRDPLFCDIADMNYHLQSASPCAPGQHPEGATICDGSRLGSSDVGCVALDVPGSSRLSSIARIVDNEPNPFATSTAIHYQLSRSGRVTLRVFDVAGREVRTLYDGLLSAGSQQATWDGRGARGEVLPAGVYFCRLSMPGLLDTRPMILAH